MERLIDNVVIGISGPAGSGKDTAANAIALAMSHKPINMKFAGTIKAFYTLCTGENFGLVEANRELYDKPCPGYPDWTRREWLQLVGTEGLRSLDPKFHIRAFHRQLLAQLKVIDRVTRHNPQPRMVVVTDVRFQNEADYIREIGGVVIGIKGRNPQTMSHSSETELNSIVPDITLINDKGQAALEDKCRVIAKDLLLYTQNGTPIKNTTI